MQGKPLNNLEINALSQLITQTLDLLSPRELVDLMICRGIIEPNKARVWLLKANTGKSKKQAAGDLSETLAIAPSTLLRLSQGRDKC